MKQKEKREVITPIRIKGTHNFLAIASEKQLESLLRGHTKEQTIKELIRDGIYKEETIKIEGCCETTLEKIEGTKIFLDQFIIDLEKMRLEKKILVEV